MSGYYGGQNWWWWYSNATTTTSTATNLIGTPPYGFLVNQTGVSTVPPRYYAGTVSPYIVYNHFNQTIPVATITTPISTINTPIWTHFTQAFEVPMPPARHRLRGVGHSPAIIHAGRRVVRRSIELYLRMRPEQELRDFVAGRPIAIQGHRLSYRLCKTRGIMEHSMNPRGGAIPFSLQLMEGNRVIASGCTYLRDTPVLDQVLALIMAVSDPETERQLVTRETNWSPRLPATLLRALNDNSLELPVAA